MIDDYFIFDCVINAYDLSPENLREDDPTAADGQDHITALGESARGSGYYRPRGLVPKKRWTLEELYEMVFVDAPTDLAMAQTVPVHGWFKDFFAPVHAQYEMAMRYPDKVLFCGGADPLINGVASAQDEIRRQVRELGARSMKFYNGHIRGSWRIDDEALAYPLFETCLSEGIDVVQFHKGLPSGQQNVEDMSPLDVQEAARDFPEMQFVIHHLAMPYFEELVSVAARFPNVHIALSGAVNHLVIGPRQVEHWIGKLLMEVGAERLLWGSEAALAGGPRTYLDAFMNFSISEDLCDGYGYPQITSDDKAKILGQNFAKLMKIDARPPAAPAVSGKIH